HAFRGPAAPAGSVSQALADLRLEAKPCADAGVVVQAAELLAEGKIVAWFEGAMETGPRALCHRSLLADPRSAAMRDRLNRRIKHRQDFRPYGVVARAEDADRFFD